VPAHDRRLPAAPLGPAALAATYLGALFVADLVQAASPALRAPAPGSYAVAPLALLLVCLAQLGLRRSAGARRPPWTGLRPVAVGLCLLAGIALKLAGDLVFALEAPLLGPPRGNNPLVLHPQAFAHPAALAALAAAVVAVVPPAEELFFRGLLYGWLRRRLGCAPAVVVDALLFGAAHGQPALLLPLAAVGAGLCLLYERTRTLWAPTLAHAALNALSVALAV
jgi:membrane protease YdiL (CAAX protease family)